MKIGVVTGPGLTALTLIPRPTSSADRVLARVINAALLAAYTLEFGIPIWALIEVLRMIDAFSFNSGNAF